MVTVWCLICSYGLLGVLSGLCMTCLCSEDAAPEPKHHRLSFQAGDMAKSI